MPTYKTPDVYVEEVSVFPPSIAEVETAVPAFIGYTAKANYDGKNLSNQAVKLSSLVEYQENFGTGPVIEISELELSVDNEVQSVSLANRSKFVLYDSVRMFYDNGGGNCYVISIGNYDSSPTLDAFRSGLSVLQAEDEPTMILFPDAVLLDDNDLYSLQQAGLLQAATLMDRFVIMDIRESATSGNALKRQRSNIETFRNSIGINNLKYGAAYAPYIVSNFAKYLKYSQIKDVMTQAGAPLRVRDLAGDDPSPEFISAIDNYDYLDEDNTTFKTQLTGAIRSVVADSESKTLEQEFQSLNMVYKKADDAEIVPSIKNLARLLGQTIDRMADDLVQGVSILKYPQLLADLKAKCKTTYRTLLGQVLRFNATYPSLNQVEGLFGTFAYTDLKGTMLGESQRTVVASQVTEAGDASTTIPLYPILSFTQPAHGSSGIHDTWKLQYTPATDYVGPDSFTITLPDDSEARMVYASARDGAVSANRTDLAVAKNVAIEVAALAAYDPADTTGPDHGTLEFAGGKLTYTPEAGYVGADTILYKDGATNKTSYIMVFDATPEALAASLVMPTRKNTAVNVDLALVADTVLDAASAQGGTVTRAASDLTYRPATGFTGEDSFSYSILFFKGEPYEHRQGYDVATTVVKAPDVNNRYVDELSDLFSEINEAVTDTQTALASYETQFESAVKAQLPVLVNILKESEYQINTLPPSAAMAGVYSRTDETRGVWKAPANVSLNSVIDVTARIDNNFQENMNIDVTGGKSVNAIRPFAGKGILVWGGRTLAGNDNEWRYISVRRFFNMVEESAKKSTYWAVFEPNDANLWIKLKAMIENYLTDKWRDGALQGAKPENAFYVNVGLGVTMSAQDILKGRLIIDIGMAVVRPAEFIVLRFIHKMLES